LEACEAVIPRKTLLPAVIYFDQRKQSVNCIIRELSAQSATLICESAGAVPTNIFELYIPNRDKFYFAAVRERNANQLRVAFIETNSISDASLQDGEKTEVLQRLDRLEAEVRKLRNVVNELKYGRRGDNDLAL
jgi:hypothetical protein